MNKHSALRAESLLERAAELYGFAVPSGRAEQTQAPAGPRPEPEAATAAQARPAATPM